MVNDGEAAGVAFYRVMAGEGPPSTLLFVRAKGVDADLRRHDGAALATSQM
jgi:hypothetical protein